MAVQNINEQLIVTVQESSFAGSGQDDKGRPVLWDMNGTLQFKGNRVQCLIYALKTFDASTERYGFITKSPRNFAAGKADWNFDLPVMEIMGAAPKVDRREIVVVEDVLNYYKANLSEQVILSIQSPAALISVPAGQLHQFKGTRAEVLAYLLKVNPDTGEQHYLQAQYNITLYSAVSSMGLDYDNLRDYQAYNEVSTDEVKLISHFLTQSAPFSCYSGGRW